jgi:hypothetical protein
MRPLSRKVLQEGIETLPVSTILGESVSKALTGKQKAFALEVAKGKMTKAGAYRKVYKADATKRTTNSEPYKLAADPRIAREIEAYQRAIEASQHRTPSALRELVISGLVEIALNADTKDAVRVQALRTLGTVTEVAAFTERKQIQTISSSETAKASILAQLQTLMQGEVTDVTSHDADSLMAELRPTSEPESVPDADPPVGGGAADGSGVPLL